MKGLIMSKAGVIEAPRAAGGKAVEAAMLEHVNVTTSSAEETAQLMCEVFGWHIRWQGPAKLGGRSIHVGSDGSYVALYTPPEDLKQAPGEVQHNHVGVLVSDLDATVIKVRAAGYKPYAHADYEPGRRFYFRAGAGWRSRW